MSATERTKQPQQPVKDQRIVVVRDLVEKMKPQIRLALPRHMTPDRMARVFLTAVQRVPKLLRCTPESLAASLITASQLGLEPDGIMGHGYLIPYEHRQGPKKGQIECQFMPGYRGLMKVARQSGEISALYARVVHERDHFEYACGLDEKLEHIPFMPNAKEMQDEARREKWSDDDWDRAMNPGPLVSAYAVSKFKDGGYQFEVMSRAQVDMIRARSKSANDGPWVTDYEAMALKTVMKRLCKWIPGSVEKDMAVGLADRVEAGLPPDLGGIIDTTATEMESVPAEEPKGALEKLVERERAKEPTKPQVIDQDDSGPCDITDNDGVVCMHEGYKFAGMGYRCAKHAPPAA